MLSETPLPFLQLEAPSQLMPIDGQFRGQVADVHIRMVQEVSLCRKAVLTTMCRGFCQDLVVARVVELQTVLSQVIADILGYGEVHRSTIVGLHVLIDNLSPMSYDGLYQQALHLTGLFIDRMDANKLGSRHGRTFLSRTLIRTYGLPVFLASGLLVPVLNVLANHAVHRVEQRLLLDAQTHRQLT